MSDREPIIIWDLDGPLLDVKRRYYRVYRDFVMEWGGTPLDTETYWERKRARISLVELLRESACEASAEAYKSVLEDRRHRKDMLALDRLQEGAVESLEALGRRHRQVLVTMRSQRPATLSQIQVLGLAMYFERILTADRPGEDPVATKLSLLQGSGYHEPPGVLIGDTPTEAMVAKRLGMISVIVSNGIRHPDLIRPATPDVLLESLSDLTRVPALRL